MSDAYIRVQSLILQDILREFKPSAKNSGLSFGPNGLSIDNVFIRAEDAGDIVSRYFGVQLTNHLQESWHLTFEISYLRPDGFVDSTYSAGSDMPRLQPGQRKDYVEDVHLRSKDANGNSVFNDPTHHCKQIRLDSITVWRGDRLFKQDAEVIRVGRTLFDILGGDETFKQFKRSGGGCAGVILFALVTGSSIGFFST